jgi:hypothetical protein
MLGVIVGQHRANFAVKAIGGEIRMQLYHGAARWDGVGAVDLDLVIILGSRGGGDAQTKKHGGEKTKLQVNSSKTFRTTVDDGVKRT